MSIRAVCLSLLCLLLLRLHVRADADAEFTKANSEFAAGRFAEAVDGYEAIARSGHISASLFYNLGNAFVRTGDLGKAILNYRRALALDPHHAEAAANLQLIRDKARALELTPSRTERWLAFATVRQYTIAAAAGFWILVFAAISSYFSNRRSVRRTLLIAAATVSLCFCVFAIVTLEHGARGARLAVVTGSKIDARLATADNSNTVLTLPTGSEISILTARGDWIYAALPNHLRGWVPASSVERVRL